MGAKRLIKEEESEFKNIFQRFRKRDFSGNTGQAIKNSTYNFATTLTAKIGSILFTIIIARLLMPELFGLYGLALSTILFFSIFTDFGIGTAMTVFISKTIDKKPQKAKGYYLYLIKIKIFLLLFSAAVLIFLSKWVANSYYQKPIYLALLAGAIYLPLTVLVSNLSGILSSKNKFKPSFFKEIILQTTRLILVPILILIFLKNSSSEFLVFIIFIGIIFGYLISTIFLIFKLKNFFGEQNHEKLTKKEKKILLTFILPLSLNTLSGAFFGYIDTIMLGRVVSSTFIAYYQTSFNLVTSASALLGFTGIALLPILSRMKGKQLENSFRRSRNLVFLITLLPAIISILIAGPLIGLIYGQAYIPGKIYLQLFSILIIFLPLLEMYSTYFIAKGRTKILSIALFISTILNILLNYIFITIGLSYSMGLAVAGACLATITSRLVYLVVLGFGRGISS